MNTRLTPQKGFSLVELLIAMTLGLFLIGGMITVFTGNKRSSEMTTEMANIQEGARYALQTISADLRSAGYQGCLGLEAGGLTDNTDDQLLGAGGLFASAVTGSVVVDPNNWQPAPIGGFSLVGSGITARAGTHTIAMQGGRLDRINLEEPMNVGGNASSVGPVTLEVGSTIGSEAGSLVLISNCSAADLFKVSAKATISGSPTLSHTAGDNLTGALSVAYGANNTLEQVSVSEFYSHIYFIGTTGVTNSTGDTVFSLYQQSYPFDSLANPPVELIQGVENMQVSFGIRDPADNTLRFVTANNAAFDASRVVNVRIGLLMSSWEAIAGQDDNKTYVLAGQSIPAAATSADGTTHAADRRFRLVFNTTVKVRNKRTQTR